MKITLISFFILACSLFHSGYAQNNKSDEMFYDPVEIMPQFPGGEKALLHYIDSVLVYPPQAVKNSVEGRVRTLFVISKEGKITNARVLKGISPECDAEALWIVKSLPLFIPGQQNNKPIPVYFTLPILFDLNNYFTNHLLIKPFGDDKAILKELSDNKKNSDSQENVYFDYGCGYVPVFSGGEKALMRYLQDSVKYPPQAAKDSIEGKVVVRFTVMENGNTDNIEILKSLSPECDTVVIRAIRNMPKWINMNKKGKIIPYTYTLPVSFSFGEAKKSEAKPH